MQIFAVRVHRDDTVSTVAVDVVKETPQFYFIEWPDGDDCYAFGYSKRIPKDGAFTSALAALEHYVARRQRDTANAQAVVAQATKQIASANIALMQAAVGVGTWSAAVDPVGELAERDPTTRAEN